MYTRKTKKRVGQVAFTQEKIRSQLVEAERDLDDDTRGMCWVPITRYQLKYRRYYLLRRLLALQLKEFK